MLDFFSGIGNFLGAIVSFLNNFFNSIFELFKWTGAALGYVAELTAYIPASLLAIALVFITVSVVYLIIGR